MTPSKSTLLAFSTMVLFILSAPFEFGQLQAQQNQVSIGNTANVNIEKRVQHHENMVIITTREGSIELLLTDDDIVVQFSEEGLNKITDEIQQSEVEHEEFSLIYDVFKSMLSSGLRTLLDHSLQIPISDLEEVIYQDGALQMITKDNRVLFDDVDVGGTTIIRDFKEEDALRFMSELERRMQEQDY